VRDALVLRRWGTAAQWLSIVAAAWAGALALNSAVAFWLDSTPDVKHGQTRPAPRSGARGIARRNYSVIFERNLFGTEPIAVPADGEPASAGDTNVELRLLGTAEVDGRGYAVLEDVSGGREDVFAVGESIFDGPKLLSVGPGTAVILAGGRKQTLEIATASAETQSPTESPSDKQPGRKSKTRVSPDAIKQTSPTSYLVERGEVEHSIQNLNQIATQMRAVPFLKDGAAIGFRVFNIHHDSIFERMGLKNGDVIQRVNGVELDSPTKALALLEDVQTTDEIRVDLLRDNAPSTLVYTVR
jgi:general secretion pathway protein C